MLCRGDGHACPSSWRAVNTFLQLELLLPLASPTLLLPKQKNNVGEARLMERGLIVHKHFILAMKTGRHAHRPYNNTFSNSNARIITVVRDRLCNYYYH